MTRTWCIAAVLVAGAALAGLLGLAPRVSAGPLEEGLRNAALSDDPHAVARWLRKGADVNAASERGDTALTLAAVRGSPKLIRALLAAKRKAAPEDNVDAGRAVLVALAYENRSAAITLLEGDASVETRTAKGETVLLLAAARKDVRLAKYVLECGADANARDKSGKTSLMIFAANGDVDGVKLLLRGGAMRELKAKDGSTALSIAKRRKNTAVVEVLEGPPVGRDTKEGR